MAWIESHIELENHPKLADLRRGMNWDKDKALGFLHRFWYRVLSVADNGDVTKLNDQYLAEELELSLPRASAVLGVMIECGLLDKINGRIYVHDWLDYAGKYLREYKYRRKQEKWREIENLHNHLKQLYMTQRQTIADTVPYRTVPNQEEKEKEKEASQLEKQPLESIGQADADNHAPPLVQTQQQAEERKIQPCQTTNNDGDNFATGTERFESSFSPKYAEIEKALKSVRAENKKTAKTNTLAPSWREGVISLVRLLENEPLWNVDDIKARYRAFLQAQAQAQRTGKDDWVKVAGLAAFANNIDKFQPVDGGQKDEPPVPIPKGNKLTSDELKARESGIASIRKALGMKG